MRYVLCIAHFFVPLQINNIEVNDIGLSYFELVYIVGLLIL